MNRRQTLLFAATIALASPAVPGVMSVAYAETAEARQSGEVFAAPGEQSRIVTRVRAGTQMTVLQRSGRWLKVRVNGRTGWVPRSIIASAEVEDDGDTRRSPFVEGRSTRRGSRSTAPKDRVGADVVEDEEGFIDDGGRKSKQEREPDGGDDDGADDRAKDTRGKGRGKRGFDRGSGDDSEDSGDDRRRRSRSDEDDEDDDQEDDEQDGDDDEDDEPVVLIVVAARAKLFSEPSRRSETVDTMREGTKVTVLERDGDWLRVESEKGGEGWVRADEVDDGPGYRYKKVGWKARAGLGYASLSQDFTSNSAVDLGNYKISAGAIAVVVGADLVYDYSDDYLIAGDLSYRFGRASPGIRFVDPATGDAVDTSYLTHDLDGGAALGYKLSRKTGMALYGRAGYHYGLMAIADVGNVASNPARLPTESLTGVTVGAHLDIPMLTPKWAVHAGVDALLFAKRKQTAGLEDGDVSDSFALWAGANGTYDWKDKLKATAQLGYIYSKTSWTGQADGSMRAHMATSASRKDASILFLIGLLRPF